MKALPRTEKEFTKAWPAFSAWLESNGSAVHKPTNPYEVARFLTDQGMGIVYRNEAGMLTNWHNGTDRAFECFRQSKPWRAVEAIKRRSKRARLFATLAERDGAQCICCQTPLTLDNATIEHFVPITAGGPDHLANMGLACEPCNKAMGHLSVAQKIKLAIERRKA